MKKLITLTFATLVFNLLQAQPDRVFGQIEWKPGTTALKSSDGRYRLDYQSDGNLVLYKKNLNNNGSAPIWAVGKSGKTPRVCCFQPDGNLVCYGYNPNVVWAANSYGKGGKILILQNDGNLVVYTTQSQAVWATDTYERNRGCNTPFTDLLKN